MADAKNIGAVLKNMPPKKILALGAVVTLIIATVMLLFVWTQKADLQPLYTNLSEEDAGMIIQKLNELRVPYSATSGGVMVPADRVYELRLQLASQGLPQGGGVGFELFDKTSFTMTDFVQKLNYRRALQGELSRTIRSLSEVEQCRVHIAIPERSLFAQKEDRPKASILVKLRPGRRLSQAQVRGIVHLVSSSVEGLDPKDVSVVDSGGEMLTAPLDDVVAAGSAQLEHQREFEREMEARIVSMLEPVVGRGKVRVKVAAAMDFTRMEKTEEKFDPDGQVVRSEQKNIEKTTNTTSTGGGVPGVASNLPGRQQAVAAGQERSASSEKKSETVNYEITKIISHTVSPAGEIKRLSVVALVDGTYTVADGSSEKKYTPRSEEDIQKFEEMVKKAVGFNPERGDEVKVVNMPFESTVQDDLADTGHDAAGSSILPLVMTILKYIVPVAAIGILFMFVIKPLMRTLASQTVVYESHISAAVQQPPAAAPQEQQAAPKELTPQQHLIEWAKKNPKEATSLVKSWLEER